MPDTSGLAHRVDWGETDAAKIIFYPNYFRWFDRGTHALFRRIGYPVPTMLREGFVVPVVECHARFAAPLHYDDEVSIVSRVEEVRTRAFRVGHTVNRDGALAVEGYEVRIWARVLPSGVVEASPLPEDVRLLLQSDVDTE